MHKPYIPPYTMILLSIGLINIIFSTYFISIFLAGVVFKILLISLKKEHYYILGLSIFIFLIIESTQGFKLFSLTLIALVLYFFIIPRIKHIFSSSAMSEIIFILLFYISIFIMVSFDSVFDLEIVGIFMLNFILDSLVVGMML